MPRFGSTLTAMVTPFTTDGALDLDGAQKLAKYLVANGNDGVVVAGTTGESATLTHDEQADLAVAVREALPDHIVIAGAGSNDTRAAIDLTERATAAGVDGILSVAPYYNRPNQAGLEAHFKASAEATDLPVLLYDIPGRTGRKINTDTMLRLFEVPNIVGVKDAAGNPAETAKLLAQAGDGIEVYSGDDGLILPLMAVGGSGVIGVATHWAGVEIAAMIAAFNAGNVAEAIALNAKLLASYDFETGDAAPNPGPTKTLMPLLGLDVGACRPPMGFNPPDLLEQAREVLIGLGRSI